MNLEKMSVVTKKCYFSNTSNIISFDFYSSQQPAVVKAGEDYYYYYYYYDDEESSENSPAEA